MGWELGSKTSTSNQPSGACSFEAQYAKGSQKEPETILKDPTVAQSLQVTPRWIVSRRDTKDLQAPSLFEFLTWGRGIRSFLSQIGSTLAITFKRGQ